MLRLLLERLEERAAADRPVTVGLAGAGRFGTSVAAQIAQIDGLQLAGVADPNVHNGAEALRAAGWVEGQWKRCEGTREVAAAFESGVGALAADAEVLESAPLEVLVEATGVPEVAALNAWRALRSGQHVVMVTVEADVSCGWALAREARRQGVVYSLAAAISRWPSWSYTTGPWRWAWRSWRLDGGRGGIRRTGTGIPSERWRGWGTTARRRRGCG